MKNWLIVGKYIFKEYVVYNLLFTILCIDVFIRYDSTAYAYIPLLKLAGYIFTSVIYYWRKRQYVYFFYNLGFNLNHLVLFALIFDAALTTMILAGTKILFN